MTLDFYPRKGPDGRPERIDSDFGSSAPAQSFIAPTSEGDRPGRFNDGPSVHRSAVADTDWHRAQKEKFADDIADRLYRLAHRGDFDKLVIVAPPLVLGEMRRKLHKEVSDRIVGEVPKTLTNHPVYEIEKLLMAA